MSLKKNTIILLILALLIMVVIYTTFIYYDNKKRDSTEQNKGIHKNVQVDTQNNSNKISYGLYNSNGNFITEGSNLKYEKGVLETTISIGHYINDNRNYMLLIMKDFKQTKFKVSKKTYSSYLINIKPNSEKNITVHVPITKLDKEIDFIIVKKPEYLVEDQDLNKASILQEVLPLRFMLNNTQEDINLTYEKPQYTYNQGPIDNVFLSKQKDKLKVLYSNKGDKEVFLSLGAPENQNMEYAAIAMLNWNQVPLINNNVVNYMKISPGKRDVFRLILPNVKKKQNYQIIIFPKPYHVNKNDYESQSSYCSFRTIITP
ncbi:hypothetical protein ACE38V_11395 [Cytobacillus sp. Hz8]|uniref:hypothetical protein n=1 Tax=Cytobacillus sp. Hz8 TaxID=3347168 RepID=UPI0035D69188